jgi:type IV fimbrial biogenesis protein FimT
MSLIEALIALAIAGILIATAMPMYSAWIQNTKIRTGAEAMLNGLQFARSEAVSRNAPVEFVMTGNTGWRVNVSSAPDDTPLQARSAGAGSDTAVTTPSPGDATMVTFDALGRRRTTNINIDTPPIDRIDVTSSITSFTEARALRITINAGGQVRMCDPDPAIPAGDTRKCPMP